MRRERIHLWLGKAETDWLLSVMAASDTMTFGEAVRQALTTHPAFRECVEFEGVSTENSIAYRALVEKGRVIRSANKRR